MKIVKIDQLDGIVEELIIRNVNKETCEAMLWLLGFEFNKVTGYWHTENEMVRLEEERMNVENLDKRLNIILNNQLETNAAIEELNTLVEELKTEFATTKPDNRKDEKRFIIPLPGLITTDGKQQYLTHRDCTFFASRREKELRQIWKEEHLKFVPEVYRQFAVGFDEDREY